MSANPGQFKKRHGMSGTKTHEAWRGMTKRCRDKNNLYYHRYGGRGIKVCKSWLKFENFYRDMGVAPKDKSLDRIDNNKGYSKSNCRWATIKEQNRNQSTTRFTEETVAIARLLYKRGFTTTQIGKIFKISRNFAWNICVGKVEWR